MCEEKESIKVKQINEEREEVEEKPTMKQTTIKDTFSTHQTCTTLSRFRFFSFFFVTKPVPVASYVSHER